MSASTAQAHAVAARLASLSLPGQVHVGAPPISVRRVSCGVEHIDTLLEGGLPCGRITELVGPLSSGKTALLLAVLAVATQRGELVACVDLANALHPVSVAAAGSDLQRVLWARPRSLAEAFRCTELLLQAEGFGLVLLDVGTPAPRPLRGQVWPRLQRAVEQSHTVLLIVAPHRIAGSCAALSLSVFPRQVLWRPGLWPLFDGFTTTVHIERNKLGAPGQRTVLQVRDAPVSGAYTGTSHAPRLSTRA